MNSTAFQVRYEKNESALRVWTMGAFDGNAAAQLSDLLIEHYEGQERVFIDTGDLRDVAEKDGNLFRQRMAGSAIPPHHIVFKGEHSLALALEGSKIVIPRTKKEHVCCGRCAQCSCADKPHD